MLTNIHRKYSWIFMLLVNKYSWQILMDIQRYSRGCVWHHPAAAANKSSDKSSLWKFTNPEFGNPQILTMEVHKCSLWKISRKPWQWKIGTKTELGLSCPLLSVAKSNKNGQIEFCSQTPQNWSVHVPTSLTICVPIKRDVKEKRQDLKTWDCSTKKKLQPISINWETVKADKTSQFV